MTDYKPRMNQMAIEMLERQIKAWQCLAKDCKDEKTIKILGADKPIIRSYDGTIQDEV